MNKVSYKPLKEEISVTPRRAGRFLRETDARILIDYQLCQAGWNIKDNNQVTTEESAAGGRADYLLLDSRSRRLAVIEAKRFSLDAEKGSIQSTTYQKDIESQTGIAVPIFMTNGKKWYFKRNISLVI